tara:strand:- start:1968 stop:3416 length:1449 start_codon:yes stop_codon:yes gene_type:complete
MGNCGVGFAPVRPEQHDMLISLMEGVEDIPEVVLSEGLPWTWRSFGEYLDILGNRRFDVDVASQVPHAPLRVFVMGERGANREPATSDDRAEMARLAAEGIRAGAFGFSTSRLLQHRTAEGAPIPSYGAAEEELAEIVDAVCQVGRGWVQVVADFGKNQESEFSMFKRLVERSGLPLTLTLLQRNSWPSEWSEILDRIASANSEGHLMTGQIRGRPTSTLLGFELSENPFLGCPSWEKIAKLDIDDKVKVLSDSEFRTRIIQEPGGTPEQIARFRDWDNIFLLGDPPQYEPEPGSSIASIAKTTGEAPEAIAFDMMMENGGKTILYHPMSNYSSGDMSCVYEMLQHPNTLIGLGDGGAHVGIMCDATDMTHAITHWTRDRTRGELLPIEDIVRRLTHKNAIAIGLKDRGLVKAGYKADLNIINYEQLQLRAPKIQYDLPAGGKRLVQEAVGYDATILSGVPVWINGQPTGNYPGKLLRSGEY